MSDKVQRMHSAVSTALEEISALFKPGIKLTFIARTPGNPEGDVLIGDDEEPLELIALVRRRFAASLPCTHCGTVHDPAKATPMPEYIDNEIDEAVAHHARLGCPKL